MPRTTTIVEAESGEKIESRIDDEIDNAEEKANQ
jgi:hypothetical protein